jgi:hypothetical protein
MFGDELDVKLEKVAGEFACDPPLDCGTGDMHARQPVCFCRSDHPLCDFGEMRSMCCLQEMVSECPRGEPLSQANDE